MQHEIERKFFVKEMPDISGIKPMRYERYFLKHQNGEEERISKVDNKYFYEKKITISDLERTGEKKEISVQEFDALKQHSSEVLIRDRYDISADPKISIQVYHAKHEGLVRAEVEFGSKEDAENFHPPNWMGKEMTGLPVARDADLLNLTPEEFRKFV